MKTDISPEALERFRMWYVRPFEWLRHQGGVRHVEPWDGGFISIMIGSALMERYFRRKTNTHIGLSAKEKEHLGVKDAYDTDFKNAAADHFGIDRCRIHDFYLVFRNGMMHQGMPKVIETKNNLGEVTSRYTYEIKAGLSHLPERTKTGKEIKLSMDPWEFTQTMIGLFLCDPPILNEEFDHGLAQIYSE